MHAGARAQGHSVWLDALTTSNGLSMPPLPRPAHRAVNAAVETTSAAIRPARAARAPAACGGDAGRTACSAIPGPVSTVAKSGSTHERYLVSFAFSGVVHKINMVMQSVFSSCFYPSGGGAGDGGPSIPRGRAAGGPRGGGRVAAPRARGAPCGGAGELGHCALREKVRSPPRPAPCHAVQFVCASRRAACMRAVTALHPPTPPPLCAGSASRRILRRRSRCVRPRALCRRPCIPARARLPRPAARARALLLMLCLLARACGGQIIDKSKCDMKQLCKANAWLQHGGGLTYKFIMGAVKQNLEQMCVDNGAEATNVEFE